MQKLRHLVVTLLVLFSLVSCAPSPEEYAVVLWPEAESSFAPGEILPIFGESEIDDTLLFRQGGTEGSIVPWRVIRFDEEEEARGYAESYGPWTETYARSLRTALPVRELPDRTSTRVYRLRDGELVKILSRENEQSDEAGFVDYWYEVLTREGISGWVFGYYLELTGASGRALDPSEEHDGIDRLVADIAETVWRPAYFNEMVSSGRIDLDAFAPRFGFFGDLEAQQFRLVLPSLDRTFDYEDYFSADGRMIEFSGIDLIVELTSDERISVRYTVNGRRRSNDFVLFDDEINLIVEAERERRAQELDRFLERGNTLLSTAYGTISLTDRGAVTWSGYQRLIPGVLQSSFEGSGRFVFDLYLADDLRGRYDGAISLVSPAGRDRFLYSFTDDGVRFIYVPSANVSEDNVVIDEPISPVVIFFRFIRE